MTMKCGASARQSAVASEPGTLTVHSAHDSPEMIAPRSGHFGTRFASSGHPLSIGRVPGSAHDDQEPGARQAARLRRARNDHHGEPRAHLPSTRSVK